MITYSPAQRRAALSRNRDYNRDYFKYKTSRHKHPANYKYHYGFYQNVYCEVNNRELLANSCCLRWFTLFCVVLKLWRHWSYYNVKLLFPVKSVRFVCQLIWTPSSGSLLSRLWPIVTVWSRPTSSQSNQNEFKTRRSRNKYEIMGMSFYNYTGVYCLAD